MTLNNTVSDIDRQRIITSYNNMITPAQISVIMGIKRTTVDAIIKKYKDTGLICAQRRGGIRTPKLNAQHKETIKLWVDEDCTQTLKELKNKVLSIYNIAVSNQTIGRILKSFHYSLKRVHLIPERRNNPVTVETRRLYASGFISLLSRFSEEQIIFIDEVGFNVSMRTGYGRSLINTPATITIPHLRSRNISICCAINKAGILKYESSNTAYNSEFFLSYMSDLITDLRGRGIVNAVFIMDNVGFHKTDAVTSYIRENGYEIMFLPPYSPFLNPIENMFSKWKNIVRRLLPNNENELFEFIEHGSARITAEDCDGYYRNMFYYITRCLSSEIIND